jgi:hypothetical protein
MERNPQPFEGSIFLIKIPIQGCYIALIERKKSCYHQPCVMYEHLVSINGNTLNWRNNKHEPAMATQVAMFYFWRFCNIFGQGLVVSIINLPPKKARGTMGLEGSVLQAPIP